jgi:hypothetical protein
MCIAFDSITSVSFPLYIYIIYIFLPSLLSPSIPSLSPSRSGIEERNRWRERGKE